MFAQLTGGLDFQANALLARAERQRVIASNIANADTPGYAARDVSFRDAMAAARGGGRLASGSRGTAPASHPGHIPVGRPGDDPGGFMVTTIIGVVGAILGGFLAAARFNADPMDEFFDISSWLTAIVGAIILLVIYRAVAGRGGGRATV